MAQRSWIGLLVLVAACAQPTGGGFTTSGGSAVGGSDLKTTVDAGSSSGDTGSSSGDAAATGNDVAATADSGSSSDVALTDAKASDSTATGTSDCCTASKSPGCKDSKVQDCVCAQDDYCCTDAWDSQCIGEIAKFKCGPACPEAPVSDAGSTDTGPKDVSYDIQAGNDCCTASEAAGCKDAAVMNCVCGQDDYCCTKAWDSICVGEVGKFKCGTACPEAPKPDAGSTDVDAGPADASYDVKAGNGCCATSAAAGCSDTKIMDCVCAKDIYCCKTKWDAQCVKEVGSMSCGAACPATGDGG